MHLDGCVEVAGAYSAPPPGSLNRVMDEHYVKLLAPTAGALLREYRRQTRGHRAIYLDHEIGTPPI